MPRKVIGGLIQAAAPITDPAAPIAELGMSTYRRADLERCWMHGSGGVAYVLLPAWWVAASP